MSERLTLMTVHAHPDDEALGTGGILARYASEGVHTVVVTCTNGDLGDTEGGVRPVEEGHDSGSVVAVRRRELEEACRILGVGDLDMLGYRDSGMMGWPQNDHPDCFWQQPVDEAAQRIAALFELHRPQVVVTYDEGGTYGHPDHLQAHRATVRAVELSGIPSKLYFSMIPKSRFEKLGEALRQQGIEPPQRDPDAPPMGVADEQITTCVDVSRFVDIKRQAALAHHSQMPNFSWLMKLPEDVWRQAFGNEYLILSGATPGEPWEADLFTGLR
ncbi:MAG: PIG-L family deacetylase [Candidatus Dormibacteria bacterium]